MKGLFKFITLLLCVELIVQPIVPSLSLGIESARAESCSPGLEWNSTLNRCLTSQQTSEVMNATSKCPPNDSQCFKTNAETAFQKSVNEGKAPERAEAKGLAKVGGGVAPILAVIGPLSIGVGGMKELKSSCSSYSFYAMIAGSVSLIAGDLLANMGHKKRLDKIKKSWGEIVNPEQAKGNKDDERQASIDAQSKAFGKLAEAEESLAKAAKMKKTFFTIAGVAYTASTAIALVEIFLSNNPATASTEKPRNICKPKAEAGAEGGGGGSGGEASGGDATNVDAAGGDAVSNAGGNPPPVDASLQGPECGEGLCPQNRAQFNERFSLPSLLDQKMTKQFKNNLKNSNDIVSFLVNKRAMEEKYSSPSIEYYEAVSEVINKDDFKDPEILETFKIVTMGFIDNLLPIQSAHARVAEDDVVQPQTEIDGRADGGSSGGGAGGGGARTSGNTNGQVQTHAAKSYREEEAKGAGWGKLIAGAAIGVGMAKIGGGYVAKKMATPELRAAFSGVMAMLSFAMAKHAGEQAEAANKRAELLKKMQADFNNASSALYACKSEDRNNPGMPNCYCYTAEGGRNQNRSNSQVCQKMWGQLSFKPGNYLGEDASRSCVAKNREPDPSCNCRKNNSCLTVSMPKVTGFSAGTMGMINSGLDPMNKLNDGTLGVANINGADLENRAARLRGLVKKLEGQKGLEKYRKAKDKLSQQMQASLAKAASSTPGSTASGFGSGLAGMPSNPAEASKMLEKELENIPQGYGGGETIATPSNSGSKDESLEFGMTEDQLATQEGQIAEAMKQDLDYGANDINQGSKTNIFEVLSNRYQRSGMRRLFDEKGETKADEAAKSDINQ